MNYKGLFVPNTIALLLWQPIVVAFYHIAPCKLGKYIVKYFYD